MDLNKDEIITTNKYVDIDNYPYKIKFKKNNLVLVDVKKEKYKNNKLDKHIGLHALTGSYILQ